MEKLTIESLMAACNVTKYPERWRTFFDEVMCDFDKNGCLYANPAQYDRIEEEYALLGEHLPVFKETARDITAREPLARYLALLCHALHLRVLAVCDGYTFLL